jgi:flagellar assembly protein FliH
MSFKKIDPSLIGEILNIEEKRKSPLIKKGKIAYEAVPFFSDAQAPSKTPEDKHTEKTVQVLKGHEQNSAGVNGQAAEVNQEELLANMREEAQKILAKARAEAEKIIAEGHNKAKKIIEESKQACQAAEQNARQEGLEAGRKEGYQAGLAELTQIMETARDTLRQAVEMRNRLEKSAEQDLALLAIKIAERIIGTEVTLNPNVILNMVRANLERVKERQHVTIRVHQEDLETVRTNKEALVKFAPEIQSMEIQVDPRVERGGCIVETNLGTVDARISTQLEAVFLAFSKMNEASVLENAESTPETKAQSHIPKQKEES